MTGEIVMVLLNAREQPIDHNNFLHHWDLLLPWNFEDNLGNMRFSGGNHTRNCGMLQGQLFETNDGSCLSSQHDSVILSIHSNMLFRLLRLSKFWFVMFKYSTEV